jgi:UDP-glucose 4-epimerase
MCKRISEKLVLSVAKTSKSKYLVTRYGNVLSSKGSIVPLFLKQANDSNYLSFTLTDPNMTRFLMTLEESVDLIDKAIQFGTSGDIWVPQLKSIKIYDLATYFSKKFKKSIQTMGVRPGEKIHEILLSAEELSLSSMIHGCYVVKGEVVSEYTDKDYSSKNCTLEYAELKIYMDNFLNLKT